MQDNELMTTPETTEAPKRKKSKIAAIIAIIVALLVLVFGGLFLYSKQNDDLASLENEVKAELGQLENKSNEEVQAALDENIEEGTIRVSINMNPVFPTGDSNGKLQLENHPNNHYNLRCVITADTNDDGEEEEVYHSGLMPVNSHIQETSLRDALYRNANRERVVPEYAIRRMFFRMQEERPRKEEGFSEIRLI